MIQAAIIGLTVAFAAAEIKSPFRMVGHHASFNLSPLNAVALMTAEFGGSGIEVSVVAQNGAALRGLKIPIIKRGTFIGSFNKLSAHQNKELPYQLISFGHASLKLLDLIVELARYSLPLACKLFGIVCMGSDLLEDAI